jgi:predicted transcriptional regulator
LDLWQQLLFSFLNEEDDSAEILKDVTQELDITLKELAELADIPISTLYKISSTEIDTRLSTLRKLINSIRELEYQNIDQQKSVGLITSRDVLDQLGNVIEINNEQIFIKEYLANTIEEEIIVGVRAVKEGVKAIICGPIAANTLRKILDIPVVGIAFSKESLIDSMEKALSKI